MKYFEACFCADDPWFDGRVQSGFLKGQIQGLRKSIFSLKSSVEVISGIFLDSCWDQIWSFQEMFVSKSVILVNLWPFL